MTQTDALALRPGVSQLSAFVELHQSLAGQVADISPFVDQLMRFLKPLIDQFGSQDESDIDIDIAVREAIAERSRSH